MTVVFEGAVGGRASALILSASALVLLTCGLWRLARRRGGAGAALAAALGPAGLLAFTVVAAILAPDGVRRRRYALAAAASAAVLAAAGAILTFSPTLEALGAVAAGAWMVTAVGVFYAGVFGELGLWRLAVLTGLRVAAAAAVFLLLVKPVLTRSTGLEADRPALTVLVDRSGSMATVDRAGGPTRHAEALAALAGVADRLGGAFDLRWRCFAEEVDEAGSLGELASLAPAGDRTVGTRLAEALAASASPGETSAGVLLLSDGIQTGSADALDAVDRLGEPIYAAGVGSVDAVGGQAGPNIRVESVDAPWEVVRDNRCTIACRLRAVGAAGRMVRVHLRQGESTLAEHAFVVAGADAETTAKLSFIPSRDNAPAGGADGRRNLVVEAEVLAGETTAADNAADVHVATTTPRIGVLYVESIRPEYKFLSRSLRRDPNLRLITVVRLSGDAFAVNGRIGGKTLDGLPATTEQWDLFDVIILGDIDSRAWTAGQLDRLARFVRAGGGLVMLGGAGGLGPGGYGATPVQEVLPVVCGDRNIGGYAAPFIPQLTADGAISPICAGAQAFFRGVDGREPDLRLPPLTGCVNTGGLKAGATALAIHPDPGPTGERIVLATRRVGRGRSVVFTPFTTWRWRLETAGRGEESPYARFWRQMIGYLADVDTAGDDEAPSALIARADRRCAEVGRPVRLTAHLRGAPGAQVRVDVVDPSRDGAVVESIPLAPAATGEGLEGEYRPSAAGTYALRFIASGAEGEAPATDELPLEAVDRGAESERLARDDALLRALARRSGGRSADVADLADLADLIAARCRPAVAAGEGDGRRVRLYGFSWGLGLFVTLLTVEWILRRRWQLR